MALRLCIPSQFFSDCLFFSAPQLNDLEPPALALRSGSRLLFDIVYQSRDPDHLQLSDRLYQKKYPTDFRKNNFLDHILRKVSRYDQWHQHKPVHKSVVVLILVGTPVFRRRKLETVIVKQRRRVNHSIVAINSDNP